MQITHGVILGLVLSVLGTIILMLGIYISLNLKVTFSAKDFFPIIIVLASTMVTVIEMYLIHYLCPTISPLASTLIGVISTAIIALFLLETFKVG